MGDQPERPIADSEGRPQLHILASSRLPEDGVWQADLQMPHEVTEVPVEKLTDWLGGVTEGFCVPTSPNRQIGFVLFRGPERRARTLSEELRADAMVGSETATDWILVLEESGAFPERENWPEVKPVGLAEAGIGARAAEVPRYVPEGQGYVTIDPNLGWALAHVNLSGLLFLLSQPGWISVEADLDKWRIDIEMDEDDS